MRPIKKKNSERIAATASPDTKIKLFAESAGFCQNPNCNKQLFFSIGPSDIHIAEMAHIVGVAGTGPRTNAQMTAKQKADISNLILLCPTCHTKIDKAEIEFDVQLIKEWKNMHSERISALFNIKQYESRLEARQAVAPIMNENKAIFELYGPMIDDWFNPESELPERWISKIHCHILPNNRKLLKMIEHNQNLLTDNEATVFSIFKQHVLDFEAKHISKSDINAIQYPEKLNLIFKS
jgi:hypothetical protein